MPKDQPDVDGYLYDAFLSYSRKDLPFVRELASQLAERRVGTWFDEEQIEVGDTIMERLQEGLCNSRYLIVCLSLNYKDSEWCKRELNAHLEREIKERTVRVLPVRLDDYSDDEVPEFLFGKYAVDVRTEHGLARLVRKVKTHLQIQDVPPTENLLDTGVHRIHETEEGAEGLDASVQLWFPHTIARPFFEVSQTSDDRERLDAIGRCVEEILNFLMAICLADLAAHHEVTDVKPVLAGLDGNGLSERIELLSKIMSSIAGERTKRTFIPHLLSWALESDGNPTPHFMALFKLALTIHAKGMAATAAKRAEGLLQQLLRSLLWLHSYRLISVGEVQRLRPSLAKGKFKSLVGVVKGFLPEPFLWQVSPTIELRRGCYLVNPGRTGLLMLKPFLLTREEISERIGRIEGGDLWMFSGLQDSFLALRDSVGVEAKVPIHRTDLLLDDHNLRRDRIIAIQCVDERLIANVESTEEKGALIDESVEDAALDCEESGSIDFQSSLNRIQRMLLNLGGPFRQPERMVVELDEIGAHLMEDLERFPQRAESFQEVALEWSRHTDQAMEASTAEEMRRVLAGRRREVEAALEDLLGGFSRTQSLFMKGVRYRGDSPYASISPGARDLDNGIKLLLSKDELDQSDGIDWLLGGGFQECEKMLDTIAKSGQREPVLTIIWRRFVRVFLYYQDSFLEVAKYMLKADPAKWRRRFEVFSRVIERDVTVEEARSILESLVAEDRSVIAGFLAMHVRKGCRDIGMAELSPSDRWEILLAPGTHASVVRELVEGTCKDCPPTYIKAMFLLLRGRLRSADTPLALNHAFETLKIFYQVPLFLEATFFKSLLSLHKDLNRQAQKSLEMAEVGRRFEEYFDEFRRKISTRDADIAEMPYVPLPIQRKLARDGYFVNSFICNIRDAIALEAVPHALRRSDVIRFFKTTLVNKSALMRLAEDKNLMRDHSIRTALCRNPKADPRQIRKFMPQLGVAEFRLIAEDRNVSQYARSFAKQLLLAKAT